MYIKVKARARISFPSLFRSESNVFKLLRRPLISLQKFRIITLSLECFGYLLGPQGVLTKFLKPQDDMQITDYELHHTNTLYPKSPKSKTETAQTHQGIKFHRVGIPVCNTIILYNVAFRDVKCLQNDPVIF